MNKKELREQFKLKRKELSEDKKHELSKNIFRQIIKQFDVTGKTVHVFIPIFKFSEVDTHSYIEFLFSQNCIVTTSITHFNPLRLSHSVISPETQYEEDKFGIPTPILTQPINENEIDLVIVPLLTFDTNGSRVGYGKGLYDQFLSKCKTDCIKIGVSFFESVTSSIPTDNSDVSLDFCVTPTKIISFD